MKLRLAVVVGLSLAAAGGCAVLRRPGAPVTSVWSWKTPAFTDDMELESLRTVVERTMPAYAQRHDATNAAAAQRLVELASIRDPRARQAAILREFKIMRVRDPLLLTAYYEPELPARRERDETFRYPIYARPTDLVDVDARVVPSKCVGCRAMSGRLDGRKLLPYFTRAEIDVAGILADRGLELAWTDDLVSLFSLHIQGSGLIRLADGSKMGVRFAGTNGAAFKSIGKPLVARGYLQPNHMSMHDIRRALQQLPEEQQLDLLAINPRYTFFKLTPGEGNPSGSLGVELTPGRSVATDPRVVPMGSIGYLVTPTYQRFVVSQDTGAAIKGAHADLFLGGGAVAEETAGRTKEGGTLYILQPRNLQPGQQLAAR